MLVSGTDWAEARTAGGRLRCQLHAQGEGEVPQRMTPSIRIETRDLGKVFAIDGRDMRAVDGVSLSIRKGEFVALLGPSGCGKSTILNMIATLLSTSSGEILIDGKAIDPRRPDPKVGYVFQRDTLFP